MASRSMQLAQMIGFGLYAETAYGRMNNIFFNASINNINGQCLIRAYVKRASGIDTAAVDMFLAENSKKYKNAKADFDGKSLNVFIPNYLKLNVQTVADFIKDYSQFLLNAGYSSSCAFCETTEGLGYTVQEDRVLEACSECHEKLAGILTDMKQERAQTGSYFRGAVGAVLGGIIGIIPWVLIGMLNYVAAISGLIMAFLSYKGYLLLKGKRGLGMLFIVIIVLIVFTYMGVILSQTFADLNTYPGDKSEVPVLDLFQAELGAPFSAGSIIFGDFELQVDTGAMWTNLLLGWVFAGIGSYTYLRRIGKESKGKDLQVRRLS